MAALTGTDAMEAAASQICRIFDTLRRRDQYDLVKRLVMITAMKSESEPEEYLEALAEVVIDDIAAHLAAGANRAPARVKGLTGSHPTPARPQRRDA